MARHISIRSNPRRAARLRKKERMLKKMRRLNSRSTRLVVFRSNSALYAQVVDDTKGHTLCHANTLESDFPKTSSKKGLEAAKSLGLLIGKRAFEKNVREIVFDRNGFGYHGRVKAIADGAREAGLQF